MTTRLVILIACIACVGLCLQAMISVRSKMRTQLSDAGVDFLKKVHGLLFDYQAVPMHRELYPASDLRKSLVALWGIHLAACLTMMFVIFSSKR
jgi:hypothetical protein